MEANSEELEWIDDPGEEAYMPNDRDQEDVAARDDLFSAQIRHRLEDASSLAFIHFLQPTLTSVVLERTQDPRSKRRPLGRSTCELPPLLWRARRAHLCDTLGVNSSRTSRTSKRWVADGGVVYGAMAARWSFSVRLRLSASEWSNRGFAGKSAALSSSA